MEAARVFHERCAAASVAARWIDRDSFGCRGYDAVLQGAHASALVVAGQAPEKGSAEAAELPSRLVLEAGRPVLLVPYAGTFREPGRRVLLVWDEGRGATRAIHDAMPILSAAKRVHLVKLLTEKDSFLGAEERLAAALDSLSAAGVPARGDLVLSFDFPPGDMVLNRACEEGSDLLVAGATAGGKGALSPVARHLLRHMTLPVLLSH
jgi:nucleotide-binding universal stress UspA family protein